jgi:glycosyltransferase involved in cell wall biosynthesis
MSVILKIRKEFHRFVRRQCTRYEQAMNQDSLLTNVFKSKHTKFVLISYVTAPFLKKIGVSHSNSLECQTAAEIFDKLGYCVDVIPLTASARGVNLAKYSYVYGLGDILIEAFRYPEIRTIVYAPGCSSRYSRAATLRALRRFYDAHGKFIPESARLCLDFSEVLYFSDLIIPLGNNFVADTYRVDGLSQNICPLNGFYYDVYDIDLVKKDFSEAKGNFLWFGSRGLVHKGLDLVLDIFRKRKDINLFICGASLRESSFFEYYRKELSNEVVNIENMGFLNIKGDQFREVMNKCCAVLFPSASEGGAVAILNVMANGGLIPIVSRSTGLDVEQYGFVFDDLNNATVEKQIDQLMALEEKEVRMLAERIKEDTRSGYSFAKYKQNLEKTITKEVQSNL